MPIEQSRLNEVTQVALLEYVSKASAAISALETVAQGEFLEFILGNPHVSGRSITVYTEGRELTVCFATSHYHIADYSDDKTEAELVEEMIEGVSDIVEGRTYAYAAYRNNTAMGGGFMTPNDSEQLNGKWWKRANRFEICSWNSAGDQTVSK